MGLDMYLEARLHVSEYFDKETLPAIEAANIPWPRKPGAPGYKSFEISMPVMYWRKANQIHKWFVDNVQGGVDECQHSYVTADQLQELHDLCKRTLEVNTKAFAKDALPPQSGFFFGSTEVDEYYWGDLEDTVKGLSEILASPTRDKFDYYYHSSW